jgi:hypothetical protein
MTPSRRQYLTEYARNWRAKNRDHANSLARAWRARNPGRGNREKRNARNARWKAGRREIVTELKRVPCAQCGGTFDPICMDFDHREGETKIADISAMMHAPLERLFAEIAKCDVVCANCHRLRTAARGIGRKRGAR